MSQKKYSKMAHELVEEEAARVLETVDLWVEKGPEALVDKVESSTKYGVEIECFVTTRRNDSLPVSQTRKFGSIGRSINTIEKIWLDIVRNNIPLSVFHSAMCHGHRGHLPEDCEYVQILTRTLKEYKKAIKGSQDHYVPDQVLEFLTGSNYAQAWLALRAGSFRDNPPKNKAQYRAYALGKIMDELPGWGLMYDGSVDASQDEIVSPILKGQTGLREVERALGILQDSGFTVNESCGAHTSVTFSGGVGQIMPVLSILSLWGVLEKDLGKKLAAFRPHHNHAHWVSRDHNVEKVIESVPFKPAGEILNGLTEDPNKKYQSINIGGVLHNKRVEYRSWAGTLDFHTWLAQIVVGQEANKAAARLSKKFAALRKEVRESSPETKPDNKTNTKTVKELFDKYKYKSACQCEPCQNVRSDFTILDDSSDSGLEHRWFGPSEDSDDQ